MNKFRRNVKGLIDFKVGEDTFSLKNSAETQLMIERVFSKDISDKKYAEGMVNIFVNMLKSGEKENLVDVSDADIIDFIDSNFQAMSKALYDSLK